MKKTLLLSTFICLSFITVLAQQPPPGRPESGTWVKVTPADAGFSIMMPGPPTEKVEPMEGRPGMTNHILTLETELGGYVVLYVVFPDEITDPAQIKTMLDRGRDGGIESSSGKLTSESDIKLSGYSGREWHIKLSGGAAAIARAYWVKRRLFQTVMVIDENASLSPEDTKLREQSEMKFLDSFTLSDPGK